MKFKQKDSFYSNFDKSKRLLCELIGEKFKEKSKIKIWIEEEAYDSQGRHMEDDFSFHVEGGIKEKRKWARFFKSINKRKLINEYETKTRPRPRTGKRKT